jgi:hypothetical protein
MTLYERVISIKHKRNILITFLLFAGLFSSNAVSDTDLKDLMTGYWYGNSASEEHKIERKWIVHLAGSGEFEIVFKEYMDTILTKTWYEFGTWDLRGMIHSTAINKIVMEDGEEIIPDTPDGVYYDEYEVLEINNKILRYRHIGKGEIFTVNRVPEGTEI